MRVARIVSITENGADAGGPQPPMMLRASAMRSDTMEKTSIAPGERDVTVNLSVRFLLN